MAYYNRGMYSSPADYYNEQERNQRNDVQSVLNMIMSMKQYKMNLADKRKAEEKEQKKLEREASRYRTEQQQYQQGVQRQQRQDALSKQQAELNMEFKRIQIGQAEAALPPVTREQELGMFEQKEAIKHRNAVDLLKINMEADRVKQEQEDLDGVSKSRIAARKSKLISQKGFVKSAISRIDKERNRLGITVDDVSMSPSVKERVGKDLANLDKALDYLGNIQFNMIEDVPLGSILETAVKALGISNLNRIRSGTTLEGILSSQEKALSKKMGIPAVKPKQAIPPDAPTATNPKTGEKMAYVNGRWVKIR